MSENIMKYCNKCNENKEVKEFRINSRRCKKCVYKANNENARLKNYYKDYYAKNIDKIKEHSKTNYYDNGYSNILKERYINNKSNKLIEI